jgi:hypothetical protein
LHLVDNFYRPVDVIGFACDKEIVLPGGHPDIKGVANRSKINISRPEQFELFADGIELYCYFQKLPLCHRTCFFSHREHRGHREFISMCLCGYFKKEKNK